MKYGIWKSGSETIGTGAGRAAGGVPPAGQNRAERHGGGGHRPQAEDRPNTLSAQLLLLSNAGLIRARRDGRSIVYAADFNAMSALLIFLTEDCCGGRPEICAPLVSVATGCCPPRKRLRA